MNKGTELLEKATEVIIGALFSCVGAVVTSLITKSVCQANDVDDVSGLAHKIVSGSKKSSEITVDNVEVLESDGEEA